MRPALAPSNLERLTKAYQYQRVYEEGRLAKGKILWLFLLPVSGRRIKTGISISSSRIKKASVRNKLKRVIREWFRQNSYAARGGYEAVVVVKKDTSVARADLKLIRKELLCLLERIRASNAEGPSTEKPILLTNHEKATHRTD